MKLGRIVDLSHTVLPGQEEYRTELRTFFVDELFPQYQRREGEWYIITELTMIPHAGTHVELPYHHVRDGADAASFPVERLIGEAVVLDFTHKAPGQPIDVGDIEAAESVAGPAAHIRPDDIVLLHTGLSRYYRSERAHDRPYLTPRAVEWLVRQRGIRCLGIDCSGIEPRGPEGAGQPNHTTLLSHGVPLIEFLHNLESLSRPRVLLFVLPLKIKGLEASPVRVIAIEPEPE